MISLPKRKKIRIPNYDYASSGAYFVTICAVNKSPVFWRKPFCENAVIPLSEIGFLVDMAIQEISHHYPQISVDKYCSMPDHVHMILTICSDENGRMISAPTFICCVTEM